MTDNISLDDILKDNTETKIVYSFEAFATKVIPEKIAGKNSHKYFINPVNSSEVEKIFRLWCVYMDIKLTNLIKEYPMIPEIEFIQVKHNKPFTYEIREFSKYHNKVMKITGEYTPIPDELVVHDDNKWWQNKARYKYMKCNDIIKHYELRAKHMDIEKKSLELMPIYETVSV